ncbi:MAG: HlyC/CorC family transporter [Treponema sp.]|nr:HlyC/CorC family transporter [Treponema sp.]
MLFSASESAFLSINKLRLRLLREKKHKGAKLACKLLEKKDILLNTCLVANNIVNIALSAIVTSVALEVFGASGVGIATIFVTIILLIFGEITPKAIGARNPEKVAFFTSPFIKFFTIILKPIVYSLTNSSKFLAKIFGVSFKTQNVSFTEEEIKTFIDVGEEEGVLETNEKKMMHKVFKFTDLCAKDIMTPRTQMIAIHIDSTLREVLELSQKTRLSRFPVYDNDIDDIKGTVYMKDILFHSAKDEKFVLKNIMRSPLFVLETKKMSSVQQTLRDAKQSIAIVIDEYSGVAGLLTVEDIAQEIFGTMYDEFDTHNYSGLRKISKNEFIANGDLRLIDINESLSLQLDSKFYETIGGFIFEKLDKIPEIGESIFEQDTKFIVEDVTDRKILKVKILTGGTH